MAQLGTAGRLSVEQKGGVPISAGISPTLNEGGSWVSSVPSGKCRNDTLTGSDCFWRHLCRFILNYVAAVDGMWPEIVTDGQTGPFEDTYICAKYMHN